MKYWFVMLMIAMSLIGCASTKTETVTVVKNVFVEIPSEFIAPCNATTPPIEQEYSLQSITNKEYLLSMYATALLQDIAVCSNRISNIAQWNKEQLTIFTKPANEVQDVKPRQPNTIRQ